ncbi:hypothetical protein [Haloferula sp. A504]|jgi:hypothetical protein|uniref:hypothetical protein n=1 Tax=Haloferula sp. A504 TaxID=3373601 RepID=UPI0031CC3457|nr:hypothetical protein [Verrucomicrobiaceae bacterium E54]
MNVTIKMDDALCREARHRAVDRGLSLSAWIAEVVSKQLAEDEAVAGGLLEALAMEEAAGREFAIPRDDSGSRDLTFVR